MKKNKRQKRKGRKIQDSFEPVWESNREFQLTSLRVALQAAWPALVGRTVTQTIRRALSPGLSFSLRILCFQHLVANPSHTRRVFPVALPDNLNELCHKTRTPSRFFLFFFYCWLTSRFSSTQLTGRETCKTSLDTSCARFPPTPSHLNRTELDAEEGEEFLFVAANWMKVWILTGLYMWTWSVLSTAWQDVASPLQNHIIPSHWKLTSGIVKIRRMTGCPCFFFPFHFSWSNIWCTWIRPWTSEVCYAAVYVLWLIIW